MIKPIILVTSYRSLNEEGDDRTALSAKSGCIAALLESGSIPVIVPIGISSTDLRNLTELSDGLLLPGGFNDICPERYGAIASGSKRCSQERDELEFETFRIFSEAGKPVFGICRGLQLINVALGGTLYQDLSEKGQNMLPHFSPGITEAHPVSVAEGSELASFAGISSFPVNSTHHQCIKDLATPLKVCATASDGVIEAVESVDMEHKWILGVQWHPERLFSNRKEQRALFEKFVAKASSSALVRSSPQQPFLEV